MAARFKGRAKKYKLLECFPTPVSQKRAHEQYTLPVTMKTSHNINDWSFEPKTQIEQLKKRSSDLTGHSSFKLVTCELLAAKRGGGEENHANWSIPIGHLTSRNDYCSATCVSA